MVAQQPAGCRVLDTRLAPAIRVDGRFELHLEQESWADLQMQDRRERAFQARAVAGGGNRSDVCIPGDVEHDRAVVGSHGVRSGQLLRGCGAGGRQQQRGERAVINMRGTPCSERIAEHAIQRTHPDAGNGEEDRANRDMRERHRRHRLLERRNVQAVHQDAQRVGP